MARAAEIDRELARLIRSLRDRLSVSQEAIAREAGLTVGAYARIERGEANPSWTTVRQLASALGVSLAELGRALDEQDSR